VGERSLLTILSDYVFVKKDPKYFVDLVIKYIEDRHPDWFVREFKRGTIFVKFPASYELLSHRTYRISCPDELFYVVLGIETLAPAHFELAVDGWIDVVSIAGKETEFIISPPIILYNNRTIRVYGRLYSTDELDPESLATAVASKLDTGVASFKIILHGLLISTRNRYPGMMEFVEV